MFLPTDLIMQKRHLSSVSVNVKNKKEEMYQNLSILCVCVCMYYNIISNGIFFPASFICICPISLFLCKYCCSALCRRNGVTFVMYYLTKIEKFWVYIQWRKLVPLRTFKFWHYSNDTAKTLPHEHINHTHKKMTSIRGHTHSTSIR